MRSAASPAVRLPAPLALPMVLGALAVAACANGSPTAGAAFPVDAGDDVSFEASAEAGPAAQDGAVDDTSSDAGQPEAAPGTDAGDADAGNVDAGADADAAMDAGPDASDAATDGATDAAQEPEAGCIVTTTLNTSSWSKSANLVINIATTTHYDCTWTVDNHTYDYTTCDGWISDVFIAGDGSSAIVGWNLVTNAMYTKQWNGNPYDDSIATDAANWAVQTTFPGGNLSQLTIE